MALATTVSVDWVRTLVNDGNHNAFTDLCRFNGTLYLTFRSCPEGHGIFASARIRVLASADTGQTWTAVFEFSVPGRDTRDPHFLVFGGRLFVYTGTWLCDPGRKPDVNDHLGYASWTDDGTCWSGPRHLEGTYGHYIWRAAAHGGRAYLCGRRKRGFAQTADAGDGTRPTESALLKSDDGLVWTYAGLFQEEYGDETAFLFEPDGAILALARSGGGRPAQLCRALPPYSTWSRSDLDRHVGGPLLAKWGDRYLVGGRKTREGQPSRMALYWLTGDRLEEIAELPSGGDTSYPGFVALGATQGLLSYYSSHEGSGSGAPPAAIYLAGLRRTV